MRVVLDTVIFVRALINPRGPSGRLLHEHADKYVIVLSPEIVKEILNVLSRPELRRRFPALADAPSMERVLEKLEQAEVVEPSKRFEVCRDPNDDKFIDCAVEGDAAYVVSEDKDILAIGEHEGIRMISADEFLGLLSKP
jgi:uncharacterized protein